MLQVLVSLHDTSLDCRAMSTSEGGFSAIFMGAPVIISSQLAVIYSCLCSYSKTPQLLNKNASAICAYMLQPYFKFRLADAALDVYGIASLCY